MILRRSSDLVSWSGGRHYVEEDDLIVIDEILEVATYPLDRLACEGSGSFREDNRNIKITVERPGDHAEERAGLSRLDLAEEHSGPVRIIRVVELVHNPINAFLERLVVLTVISKARVETHRRGRRFL